MRRKQAAVGAIIIGGAALAGALVWNSSARRERPAPSLSPERAAPSLLDQAIAQAGSGPAANEQETAIPPAWKARFARFQGDAETACQCARRSPGQKKDCWAKFEREIAPYPHAVESPMCGPIAPTSMCLGTDYAICIPTEYSQVRGASFCTPTEARAASAVYRDADRRRASGQGRETGEEALVLLSQALARGERVAPSGPPGCGA